jgi:Domain of unknown function (DUF1902)
MEAHCDAEARIWWADSKDTQALVAEAATGESLQQVLEEHIQVLTMRSVTPLCSSLFA